jgi:hypothetical protein
VNHLRHGNRAAGQPKQVQFLPAQRGIVLVDAQDQRLGLAVEAQLEVGIAQTIAGRLHFDDAAA